MKDKWINKFMNKFISLIYLNINLKITLHHIWSQIYGKFIDFCLWSYANSIGSGQFMQISRILAFMFSINLSLSDLILDLSVREINFFRVRLWLRYVTLL